MLCEARVKLFRKLLVIPAAISFLGSSAAIALQVESNSPKGFGVKTNRDATLIAQGGQEDAPAGAVRRSGNVHGLLPEK